MGSLRRRQNPGIAIPRILQNRQASYLTPKSTLKFLLRPITKDRRKRISLRLEKLQGKGKLVLVGRVKTRGTPQKAYCLPGKENVEQARLQLLREKRLYPPEDAIKLALKENLYLSGKEIESVTGYSKETTGERRRGMMKNREVILIAQLTDGKARKNIYSLSKYKDEALRLLKQRYENKHRGFRLLGEERVRSLIKDGETVLTTKLLRNRLHISEKGAFFALESLEKKGELIFVGTRPGGKGSEEKVYTIPSKEEKVRKQVLETKSTKEKILEKIEKKGWGGGVKLGKEVGLSSADLYFHLTDLERKGKIERLKVGDRHINLREKGGGVWVLSSKRNQSIRELINKRLLSDFALAALTGKIPEKALKRKKTAKKAGTKPSESKIPPGAIRISLEKDVFPKALEIANDVTRGQKGRGKRVSMDSIKRILELRPGIKLEPGEGKQLALMLKKKGFRVVGE